MGRCVKGGSMGLQRKCENWLLSDFEFSRGQEGHSRKTTWDKSKLGMITTMIIIILTRQISLLSTYGQMNMKFRRAL